jgi:glyoxylase-like metal-dependent hydrolase (beta-lactamase superfamily II)
MTCFICRQCGSQFADSARPPAACPVCEDERQYVRWEGQDWLTLEELRASHKSRIEDDAGLLGIGITPAFAIGQRALLVEAADGNVLWDCVSLLSDDVITTIKVRGGLAAIAISHPHYYTTMVEWSAAFGDIPIYLHADDRQWVMRPDRRIVLWEGETRALSPTATLIRCGGHFAGGTVLHVKKDQGLLLTGDILQVTIDRRHVTFMRSFPNYIPLNAATVKRVAAAVAPFAYDRIYGAWWNRNILTDAQQAVARSVTRYLAAIA